MSDDTPHYPPYRIITRQLVPIEELVDVAQADLNAAFLPVMRRLDEMLYESIGIPHPRAVMDTTGVVAPDLCPTCGAYWDCAHGERQDAVRDLGRSAALIREATHDRR